MQAGVAIGGIERLSPSMGFLVDFSTRFDEGGDIGNGVADQLSRSQAFDKQCLIEIHRLRRIDSDEGDVGLVGRR